MLVGYFFILLLTVSASELPSVDFVDLVAPNDELLVYIKTALTSLGALQIRSVPIFEEARAAALLPLAGCLQREGEARKRRQGMDDGSQRISTGAASIRGKAQPFSSPCGDAAGALRLATDLGVRQLLLAIDVASSQPPAAAPAAKAILAAQAVLRPSYYSYEDMMREGEHLEHLHAYYAPANSTSLAPSPTIAFHTDGGLFIAMTSGLYARGDTAVTSSGGLYLETAAGNIVKLSSADLDDSLVIMVGEAGAKWLAPKLGAPLRAVPHMLVADLPPASAGGGPPTTRAWYGKMYLPPADALVAGGMPYRQFREEEMRILAGANGASSSMLALPSACGPSARALSPTNKTLGGGSSSGSYRAPLSSTQCITTDGDAGIYCWTQCMPVQPACGCGTTAQCYNSATESVLSPDAALNVMCAETCAPRCMENQTNATATAVSNNGFCYGAGTSMIMDGFSSQALAPLLSVPCINFLFPRLTMDSRLKFAAGCTAAFFLALLLPYVYKARILIAQRWIFPSVRHRSATMVGLYLCSTTLGYLLMLLAMTYSAELFLMVIAGLTVGYFLFMQEQPIMTSDLCCDEGIVFDTKSRDAAASASAPQNPMQGLSQHGLLGAGIE